MIIEVGVGRGVSLVSVGVNTVLVIISAWLLPASENEGGCIICWGNVVMDAGGA